MITFWFDFLYIHFLCYSLLQLEHLIYTYASSTFSLWTYQHIQSISADLYSLSTKQWKFHFGQPINSAYFSLWRLCMWSSLTSKWLKLGIAASLSIAFSRSSWVKSTFYIIRKTILSFIWFVLTGTSPELSSSWAAELLYKLSVLISFPMANHWIVTSVPISL